MVEVENLTSARKAQVAWVEFQKFLTKFEMSKPMSLLATKAAKDRGVDLKTQ